MPESNTHNLNTDEQTLQLQFRLLQAVLPHIDLYDAIRHFVKNSCEILDLATGHIYQLDVQKDNKKSIKVKKHTLIAHQGNASKPDGPLLQKLVGKCMTNKVNLLHLEQDYFGFLSTDCQILIAFENSARLDQNRLVELFRPALLHLNEYCYICSVKPTPLATGESHIDRLTKLPDRRDLKYSLLKQLSNAIRQKYYGALLYLNIDNFRIINNSLGHSIGDIIISMVADRLRNFCRAGDYIFRMGGDEFVFILNHLGDREDAASISAQSIAVRLMETMVVPFEINQDKVNLNISIGISLFPSSNDDDNDAELFLKQANMAMDESKEKGKNCITMYNQELQLHAHDHFVIYNELLTALDNNEFELVYQPIVDTDGNIISAEALLRWTNRRLGKVSPEKFIPLADESNLILKIGDWIIQNACQFTRQLREAVPDDRQFSHVSLNISPRQLEQQGFINRISEAVNQAGIQPEDIKLEITENTLVNNLDKVVSVMKQLNKDGFNFILDDFGTGYSSLSYLYKLPISTLKIDKSFVSGGNSEDIANKVIVDTILAMTEKMNLKCVVEGVETLESACYFIDKKVYGIQGYYYHKPMAGGELLKLLKERAT